MKSKRVLIACDNDDSGQSLWTFFQNRGYKVVVTKVVSEIIRKVRERDGYVVVLDEEIEGVRASDLVSLFKKINPRVQIIVISSEASLGWAKRLRGAGIFYQAMKPVDLEEVQSAVECAFEKIDREQVRDGFFPFLIPGRVPA